MEIVVTFLIASNASLITALAFIEYSRRQTIKVFKADLEKARHDLDSASSLLKTCSKDFDELRRNVSAITLNNGIQNLKKQN